ncbi:MAG TPA: ATP-binding cassette domain-containing protein [Vicinamibacterales bacterium]|jgi:ABC-2 type transport system ATP-binding protein
MIALAVSARDLTVHYGRRRVFQRVSFDLGVGQSLGVIGPNGSGKTTLLRALAGLLTLRAGELRINGLSPHDAYERTGIAYFAGDATLPGSVRAARWGSLGNGDAVTPDTRLIRALSRGTRQLLGLRTALGRQPLGLIILDEPWEGLDPDAARWLSTILETKRDRGAGVVLSSHRLHDLAGLCDMYLFLLPRQATLVHSHDIAPGAPVTADLLAETFDRLRGDASSLRAVS